MRKAEINNVEERLEKILTMDGNVGGLKKHASISFIIVIIKGESK